MVHLPALPLQQDMKTPVAVAYPRIRQVSDPDSQLRLLIGDAPVAATGPVKLQHLAYTALADLVTYLEYLALGPQLSRL